jgi:cell division protein FtsL
MSGRARRYLMLLAVLLVAAFVVGTYFYREIQKNAALDTEKATSNSVLDDWNRKNADAQQEIDEAQTDEWVIEKGHELGMVLPGEKKIVDEGN